MNNYPPQVKIENIPCPIDGSTKAELVCEGTDKLHDIPGVFQVVRCEKCGLMRTTPRPTIDTISAYYPTDYQPYLTTRVDGNSISQQTEKPSLLKQVSKRIINFNTTLIPEIKTGTLLEIGCASGSYLYKMHAQGWHVEGIEPDNSAAERARELGFLVHTGSIEKTELEPDRFDLVVGWMVVEHLHEPIESLKKVRNYTKRGGWLAISVPNAQSLEFRIFRQNWFALQLPTHTFHYTPQSIKTLLTQSGWEVQKIFHQRILTNWFISMGYWLQSIGFNNKLTELLLNFGKAPWFVHQILYPIAWIMSLFGQTGRMTIWAKRDDD